MENEKQSFLPFTEEELKELNFTPEELEILETASAYSQTLDMLPENPDEFLDKINENFNENDKAQDTFQKLSDLSKTDPDFVNQMIAFQEVFSACKAVENEEDSENLKE